MAWIQVDKTGYPAAACKKATYHWPFAFPMWIGGSQRALVGALTVVLVLSLEVRILLLEAVGGARSSGHNVVSKSYNDGCFVECSDASDVAELAYQ